MNIVLLWGEAMEKGYSAPIWMTYQTGAGIGGQVRKGEHGSLVVYANSITRTETNEKGEDIERAIPFMKAYTVFNIEQIDGLPAHYYAPAARPAALVRAHRERRTVHDGDRRGYQPRRQQRFLCARARPGAASPFRKSFRDKESYYATALHEVDALDQPQDPP